jgi:hypothetical protein
MSEYVAISQPGEVTTQVMRDEKGLAAAKTVGVTRGPSKDESLNIKKLLQSRNTPLSIEVTLERRWKGRSFDT